MSSDEQKHAQINVRVSLALADRIDAKRVAFKQQLGSIPSRSEIVRLAIEEFVKDIPVAEQNSPE